MGQAVEKEDINGAEEANIAASAATLLKAIWRSTVHLYDYTKNYLVIITIIPPVSYLWRFSSVDENDNVLYAWLYHWRHL